MKKKLGLLLFFTAILSLSAESSKGFITSIGGGADYPPDKEICVMQNIENEDYYTLIKDEKVYYWCFRDGKLFDEGAYSFENVPKNKKTYKVKDYYVTDSKTKFTLRNQDKKSSFNFSINVEKEANGHSFQTISYTELNSLVDLENLPEIKEAKTVVTYQKAIQNKDGNVYKFQKEDLTTYYVFFDEMVFSVSIQPDGNISERERLAHFDEESKSEYSSFSQRNLENDFAYGIGSDVKIGIFNKAKILSYFVVTTPEEDFDSFTFSKSSLKELEEVLPNYREYLYF